MSENLVIAIVAAIPPTIAAAAAWRSTRKMRKPLDEVNAAVNHRTPGERRLVETVNYIATELAQHRSDLARIDQRLERHLAYHQEIEEEGDA